MVLLLDLSCAKETKLVSKKDSMKKEIHNDTIFGNLKFGYNRSEVYKSLNMDRESKYVLPIFDDRNFEFYVSSRCYNDSLYSISFTLFDKECTYKDIVDVYTIKYGKPDSIYTESDEPKTKVTSWHKGNLGIKVETYSISRFTTTSINYDDLLRVFNEQVIPDKAHSGTYWTKSYYKNVYLPRKKKSLNGI